jgi:FG-GAP-like repeat
MRVRAAFIAFGARALAAASAVVQAPAEAPHGVNHSRTRLSSPSRVTAVLAAACMLLTGSPGLAHAAVAPVTWASADVTTGYDFESTATGDFTGDGLTDVLATTFSPSQIYLFSQQGDGSLTAPIAVPFDLADNTYVMALAAGRFNSDRRLDVAVATTAGVSILLQRQGALVPSGSVRLHYGANGVLARHMLGGGRTDLVVNSPSGIYVLQNRGHRGWKTLRIWSDPVVSIAAGDVTNDGKRDVIFYEWKHLEVLARERLGTYALAGRYSPVRDPRFGHGVAIGDVTGDGLNDVVLTIADNTPKAGINVFAGTRTGLLAPPFVIHTTDIPEAVGLADLNEDRRKDLVLLHGGYGEAGVLMQQEDGSLGRESLSSVPFVSHYLNQSLSIADINADGKQDLAIGSTYLVILRQS